jgi:hypothetical protein
MMKPGTLLLTLLAAAAFTMGCNKEGNTAQQLDKPQAKTAEEVRYSSYRRQYIHQDGRIWVSRPAPPSVWVDVLFASPSVRLDFQDAPAIHHSQVVQEYSKNWAPPVTDPNYRPGDSNYISTNGDGER